MPLDAIALIESSLTITDEPTGAVLRPSPQRLRKELKRRGISNRRRAIRVLADQAREAGNDRRARYLQAYRMGLTGKVVSR